MARASRWEDGVLAFVVAHFDSGAVGGKAIRTVKLDQRLFDATPESHGASAVELRDLHDHLALSGRADDRLGATESLLKKWSLSWDIYSPKLERFIEVDETQHFSRPRLSRLREIRSAPWGPRYHAHFWENEFSRLEGKPYRDLDPPHRDEQRAYLDEMRDRLPALYHLRPTIRLDHFTLTEYGADSVGRLLSEMLVDGI